MWTARLTQGKPGFLVVRSGSMRPLLCVGEQIRVVPCHRLKLSGDLVVYQQAGKLVCHRLIFQYAPGRFYCKGDLNQQGEKVRGSEILGRPDRIVMTTETIALSGARFRCWNGLTLLVVILRMFCQIPGKIFKRASGFGDGFFINILGLTAGKIRTTRK
jgi:hypothetical protein